MITVTFKVSEALDTQIEASCRRLRISKSAFIRQVLESSLKKQKKNLSAYDIAKRLCGVIRKGASDSATNPKYLSDFGT